MSKHKPHSTPTHDQSPSESRLMPLVVNSQQVLTDSVVRVIQGLLAQGWTVLLCAWASDYTYTGHPLNFGTAAVFSLNRLTGMVSSTLVYHTEGDADITRDDKGLTGPAFKHQDDEPYRKIAALVVAPVNLPAPASLSE